MARALAECPQSRTLEAQIRAALMQGALVTVTRVSAGEIKLIIEDRESGCSIESSTTWVPVPRTQGSGLKFDFAAPTISPPPSPIPDADQIEKLFRIIDADGSGEIDLAEFKLACLLSISDESLVEATFAKIDTDGSGEVGLDEFREGFGFLQEQISHTRAVEDQLRQESAALELAGEELEESLHMVQKTGDVTHTHARTHTHTHTKSRQVSHRSCCL
jgi:hypothetical protein